ncbi:DUF2169 family type VI secretion system accessory protein [Rhodopirellula sp. JC639]|uniref:DUF2169 family type VI secretion system accessory protein n=1 Tax=Stieleria mannarensis TaxID=2755585 RepID=UPI001603D16B|nr:DUF2169 domain-containing protein [Rhodopirellula sp. JC639]
MELLNATKLIAGYTMGMKPDGRELLVVVAKGTFDFPPHPNQIPQLAAEQVPLVMADEFTGQPGFSATTAEVDFVPTKPKAEVLLNGSAYAPGGIPAERVTVALTLGGLSKQFDVVGNRTWQPGLRSAKPSPPEPFTSLPITYDVAFGGLDDTDDPSRHQAYRDNPIGVGFHARPRHPSVQDRPLPNTEESSHPVVDPKGNYRPMSFGPIGRSWPPRIGFAGTYDEAWQENQFPFLPTDFDERYYQSAPEDQQLDRLTGNEMVELTNLTPEGRCQFRLPKIDVPVEFVLRDFESVKQDATLDTVIIDTDKRQFSLVWRASHPLRQNMFEINMGIVGRMPRGWYRARETGKSYYGNLNELIMDRD